MSGLGRRLDNDRWKAVSPYLDRAMDMEQGERSAWLATLREQHPAVAADLEQLLDERDTILEEGFLEDGAVRAAGTPIAGGMRSAPTGWSRRSARAAWARSGWPNAPTAASKGASPSSC